MSQQLLLRVGDSGSSPAAFAPSDLTGHELWLDAVDDSQMTFSSGVKISQWADKSVNEYHFNQTDETDQPSHTLNGSYLGATFVRSPDHHLDGEATYTKLNNFFDGGSYAVIVLQQDLGSSGTNRDVLTVASMMNISVDLFDGLVLFNMTFDGTDGAWETPEDTVGDDIVSIIEISYDSDSVANVPTITVNGTTVITQVDTTPTGTRDDDSAVGMDIGGEDQVSNYHGWIHEINLYSTIPSTDDKASLRTYLADKWGVTLP